MLPLNLPVLAASGVPMLCIDTCSLLDIMRDPTHDHVLPDQLQAAHDLVLALEQGRFHCLVADQVGLEFNSLDADVQTAAEQALDKLVATVDRINSIHALFAPGVPVSLGHLKSHVAAARAVVGRWILASHTVVRSADALGRAFDRVNLNRPPAKRGKDSSKDCVIFETYLEIAADLRAAGLAAPMVFLSSNTKEYGAPAIAAEISAVGMSYAPNMTTAKYRLGV